MSMNGLTTANLETMTIEERILLIRQSLPTPVRLIAVSKQVSSQTIRLAYKAGIRDFGENRLQEAIAKQQELEDLPGITWHFIGHLQSNKVRKTIEHFQWIHSVDRLTLAQRIDQLVAELSHNPNLLLQVKLVPDPHKSGWSVPELMMDLPKLDQCRHLRIQGLMTICPLGLTPDQIQDLFQRTKDLANSIRSQPWQNLTMTELSMGMSGDYTQAIQANTTMVRLGQLLFGKRP